MSTSIQTVNSTNTPNVQYVNSYQDQPLISFKGAPDSDTFESSAEKPKKKKTGLIIGGIVLAGAAIATAIFLRKPKDITKIAEKNADAFKKIKADKLSGKFKVATKNGETVIMQYKKGILQNSTKLDKEGKELFTKTYETINGEKIVKTLKDGKETVFNITQRQNEVKEAQTKLKDILANKDKLTSTELAEQTKDIKYLNKAQKQDVASSIKTKATAEEAAKKAQEEAAKKAAAEAEVKAAEEAAKKAEVEAAKKAQEKAAKEAAEKAAKEAQEKAAKEAAEKAKAENLKKATEEYQARLKEGKSLAERAKGCHEYWDSTDMPVSTKRISQLERELTKEQIAALDDRTIDLFLHNTAGSSEFGDLSFLKGLTPDEIIKIQRGDLTRFYLNNLSLGNFYDTEGKARIIKHLLNI